MKEIFVFEPDEALFDIISLLLENKYKTRAIGPHRESLSELLYSGPAALIIIDCYLDLKTPAYWCSIARSFSADIPLLAMSCDERIAETYSEMGFDDYLIKPFDIQDFYHLIEKFGK